MLATLPAEVRATVARMPISYEAAKNALTNCASIDECQEWANKAEALASYAKQADDDTLRKLADRIQARAVRRCGELLKQFDGRGRPPENTTGAHTISRAQVAADAGLSKHKADTAVRVANVPAAAFEAAVESAAPPTVTKLAEMGTRTRAPDPAPPEPAPAGFKEATAFIGTIKMFSDACEKTAPELVANGVMRSEIADLRRRVSIIDGWMDRFVVNLKGP